MSNYNDTYFFNSKRATKIAKKRNKLELDDNKVQLCFSNGCITNKNLINVEIESFKEFFKNTSYRYPTYVDFIGSEYENNEELQDKIIKIFATIFDELNSEDQKLVNKLFEEFKNLKIEQDNKNTRVAFIVTKKQKQIFKYLKKISKELNKDFDYKFLTEKSNLNMILDEIRTKDVFKFLLDYKPNTVIFYNEFYPQLFHKYISHIYIVNSFSVCNKIIEYEDKIDMTKNYFFTSSSYYKKVLDQKDIKSLKLNPIVENIPSSFNSFNNRKIDLMICENYFDITEYIVFQKMIKKVNKFLNKNKKLSINKLISFIEKTTYPNNDDWELNIFIHKHIVLQNILNSIKLDKKVEIIGKNWDNILNDNYNITIKYNEKVYNNTKYVFVISSTIINENLLNILKYGAIPIIYDLRDEDIYYDSFLDDYCLFIDKVTDIEDIIHKSIKPFNQFDRRIEDKYNITEITRSLTTILI